MTITLVARALWSRQTLLRRDGWSRERLEAHQARALAALRAHAYAHSPFYQRHHAGHFDRPLHELPILTKAMLMANFDEVTTDRDVRRQGVESHVATMAGDGRYLDRYWVNATSGSTGRPGLFLFDEPAWARVMGGFARAYDWAGIGFRLHRRRKLAVVASSLPWHMSARVAASAPRLWTPTLRLDARTPMGELVAALNAWQPETLIGYASMIGALAGEQLAGRLRIAPMAVLSSSEVLTAIMRQAAESAWGAVVFEEYASTETGMIAAECSHHRGLHMVEDEVIIEVVTAQGEPVGPGQSGDKLLVTCLFNRAQPLIRYELSDMVRLATEQCPCGRPYRLIDGIQGRQEEVLCLPGPGGQPVRIHPNTFHQALELLALEKWQVVQQREALTVFLEGRENASLTSSVSQAVLAALAALGVDSTSVDVRWVATIPRGPSGKAPLVRREP